jgi:molybdopterin molybdotransferase
MARLPVSEALARILDGAEALEAEQIPLLSARQRTLATGLSAQLTQPPFDVSAMDGYAVRAADAPRAPTILKLIGESAAGRRFQGTLEAGSCVRIFTGAPTPDGSDSVVIQEDAHAEGATITLTEAPALGQHIRRRGLDFTEGQVLLEAGTVLDARGLTLAASMGHGEVPCRRRPRVAILATGDELVWPGSPPGPDSIFCSNTFGLAAMVESAGGEAIVLGIARDTHEALAEKIAEADHADILVTTGGASVGDHDLVAPALQKAGMALDFWKIAMRPGKPLMFGVRTTAHGRQRVLGLPGNPVSSLICGRVFLVPLIQALLGRTAADGERLTAQLTVPLDANGPRAHYMRARLSRTESGSGWQVTPVENQDSSLVSPLATASALIVRDIGAPAVQADSLISVIPIDF